MSGSQHDPVKDWLVDLWREGFGNDGRRNPNGRSDDQAPAVGNFRSIAPFVIAAAAVSLFAPRLAEAAGSHPGVVAVATGVYGARWVLIAVAVLMVAVDAARWRAHRWERVLEAIARQATGHKPRKVRVAFPPGMRTLRSARVSLPAGSIIRPKQFTDLDSAVKAAIRGGTKWVVTVTHEAHRDRIVVVRSAVAADTRSARHKALVAVVADGPLKNPTVTVEERDDAGVEIAYRIAFDRTLNVGVRALQAKLDESLAELAGAHESGRDWISDWHPADGYMVLKLVAPLPKRMDHPLELVDEDLRHLPYATAAADTTMFWDVSTKSNKPHCLIVGPTGGGKTSVIRTLLTEAARRGIPFLGVDPKMIELDGLEGYPGCGAIVYDAVRAARLIRALHHEMMARNKYVHVKKIEPSELPLLIAVLDEFFILSGKWQRLAKTGDDDTKELLKKLDPLGAWADLAVLARSAGIRLLLGVQRPDASLFGSSSGNARDNFGTRISLGTLSQDGALMLWGDAHVGRDVDTSVPGRGVVMAPDGSPEPAQMWWTPNVDRHPNKWGQLSTSEQDLVDGLQPQEAPQFTFYSRELREFVQEERALAKRARELGSVPEPTGLDDAAADAVPAHFVTAGQTILVDGPDDELVAVLVDDVEVRRDPDTGDVVETILTAASEGRVKTKLAFDPGDVVFLPEPDRVAA